MPPTPVERIQKVLEVIANHKRMAEEFAERARDPRRSQATRSWLSVTANEHLTFARCTEQTLLTLFDSDTIIALAKKGMVG